MIGERGERASVRAGYGHVVRTGWNGGEQPENAKSLYAPGPSCCMSEIVRRGAFGL